MIELSINNETVSLKPSSLQMKRSDFEVLSQGQIEQLGAVWQGHLWQAVQGGSHLQADHSLHCFREVEGGSFIQSHYTSIWIKVFGIKISNDRVKVLFGQVRGSLARRALQELESKNLIKLVNCRVMVLSLQMFIFFFTAWTLCAGCGPQLADDLHQDDWRCARGWKGERRRCSGEWYMV